MDHIHIRGARTHNLDNLNLSIPRDKLVVITGLSGSGKSSLAFDTLYAEGQRRYVESLSAYARQFLSMMEKPDVDHIEGLSPAISIEQKSTSHNPRSTVGTITEIHDYLRLLFARVGIPQCPEHQHPLSLQTISQMTDKILQQPEGTRLMLLAPLVQDRKGEHLQLFEQLQAQGFVRVRIDHKLYELDERPTLNPLTKHTIELVVDRFRVRPDIRQRLAESLETALNFSEGVVRIAPLADESPNPEQETVYSSRFACPFCGYSLTELEPRMFSFNSPHGACSECDGLGHTQFFDPEQLITHPDLSLAGGAIRGWTRRNHHYFQLLSSVSNHYQVDMETPWNQLPDSFQNILLYGSDDLIAFTHVTLNGRTHHSEKTFEGVIRMMERRYRETDMPAVREELARYQSVRDCPSCGGTRLHTRSRHVFIGDMNLPMIAALSIDRAQDFFQNLSLTGQRAIIAEKILDEIRSRLQFLINVGLNYLSLNRSADTLSGGEAQRIRLASQIGAGLVGVMYVLDEPSIGLHQRDNRRLLDTLIYLRDLGNTVIVVEHDEEAIKSADHVIDIGPGAGKHGGQIVASGTPEDIIAHPDSLTGAYLSGRQKIAIPSRRDVDETQVCHLLGVSGHNLQNVDLHLPARLMTCITGVSGSGKSTLINDTLYQIAARDLNGAQSHPSAFDRIENLEMFDKVVNINQSPIGRTPRSNPATYTGLFTPIRELFAATREARSRGYKPGRFSFNVKGGRCEACQGEGLIKVEMHFLPDVYVPCDNCQGERYNQETLQIQYKHKNIHEVLNMTVEEGHEFFQAIPTLERKLQTLIDVGLPYIQLGQSATTLSGGEAQRVKLSKELSRRSTGNTLYILDEPTTGLHFHDVKKLLEVLHRLRDQNNTIVVIEHNLDVIKTADWVIDLGPEGGSGGGRIIASGTPEQIAQCTDSYTGQYLKETLEA
jgi:excinuclease ABC subunit A